MSCTQQPNLVWYAFRASRPTVKSNKKCIYLVLLLSLPPIFFEFCFDICHLLPPQSLYTCGSATVLLISRCIVQHGRSANKQTLCCNTVCAGYRPLLSSSYHFTKKNCSLNPGLTSSNPEQYFKTEMSLWPWIGFGFWLGSLPLFGSVAEAVARWFCRDYEVQSYLNSLIPQNVATF